MGLGAAQTTPVHSQGGKALGKALQEDVGTQGHTHLPFCCPCRRPAQGFKGEAPSKPQNLVLPPHTSRGKQLRLLPFALPISLLSSSKLSSSKGSKQGVQARSGVQSMPKVPQAPVHEQEPCALQSATCSCPRITSCMGDPLAPVQSPCGWNGANMHPTDLTCRSATAGKCIWQTSLFTNSSNLEDKVPSLSPAPGRGVTTWERPSPAALISWQRCRRGRSHQESSPGAPQPGGAAQLCG